MNRQRDMEAHYGTSGCPYITPENFAAFYGGIGIDHGNTSYAQSYPMNEQESLGIPLNSRELRTCNSGYGGMPTGEDTAPAVHVTPEECSPDHDSSQELLDLGEALGTESRGLSHDLINTLPTSRYKPGRIFSRKRSKERCIICQMRFRIGEKRTKLPWEYISKWLSINKVCPMCNAEVLGEESKPYLLR